MPAERALAGYLQNHIQLKNTVHIRMRAYIIRMTCYKSNTTTVSICVICAMRTVKVWVTFCGIAPFIQSAVHYF